MIRDELVNAIRQVEPNGPDTSERVAAAVLTKWRLVPVESTDSCAPDDHIVYESCGICGDIPEEIADQYRKQRP